jgi:hypothetical protein
VKTFLQGYSLKQKFTWGLVALILVSLNTLWGVRLMGKTALFHYVERDHNENMMNMAMTLASIENGTVDGSMAARQRMLQWVQANMELASRADSELVGIEKLILRVFGFGEVIDLPRQDNQLHGTMQRYLEQGVRSALTPAEAAHLRPQLQEVSGLARRFIVVLRSAVVFLQTLVLLTTLVGMLSLMLIFMLLRNNTLDISAKGQYEEEILALNASLEQRVTQRTAELSTAIQRLTSTQEELVQAEKLASL